MKAICLNQIGGAEAFSWGDIPAPRPRPHEVLIRVCATGVTPAELDWFPTFHTPAGTLRSFPVVLGHEFSGVVAATGEAAKSVTIGDEVYGLNDWFSNGAQAEYCVATADALAPKPRSLSHSKAAVVPISALTAWQALYDRANITPGQRILIHGAAGNVGAVAVQLARARGAHVIATISANDFDFVRSLGAAETIDYHRPWFEGMAKVDVVFDTVGGQTLDRSWSLLKSGGSIITVATSSGASQDPTVRAAFLRVRADRSHLMEIGRMIDAQQLQVFLARTYPLQEAARAYAQATERGLRGKIALQVSREQSEEISRRNQITIPTRAKEIMNTIKTKDGTQIYFKDWGAGRPIVFSHGWPLSSDAWESQMFFLASNGFRCIAHDRRGHGRSSQPWNGNDMDQFADDLAELLEKLDVKNAVLIGHSTGGGEVARYIGRHGTNRIAKAVLMGAVPPIMVKTAANPGGLPLSVFDGFRQAYLADRAQFFLDVASGPFFNFNKPGAKVSEGLIRSWWMQGMMSGHKNAYDCIQAFSETDFTEDLKKFDLPTLILHGDADQIVPIDASAKLSAKLVRNALLKIYPGGSHSLGNTSKEQLNADLLSFARS